MRWILAPALLLAACSKGPDADLPSIAEARSLAAEWALVNEQAGEGRLTQKYVSSMHRWLREELGSASASLQDPGSRYGEEIDALLSEPDDAPPQELRAHAEALKRIEDALESA